MSRIVLSIYHFFSRRKWLVFTISALLLLLFGYFASRLTLEEDISGFMPGEKNNEKINFLYKNIGVSERIIVKISSQGKKNQCDSLLEAADYFANHLKYVTDGKNLVHDVFYKIDQQLIFDVAGFITQNLPYYLSESDYERIDRLINRDSISKILANNKKLLISPAGMVLKQQIISDPLHLATPVLSRLNEFQISSDYIIYNNYIFSNDSTNILLFVTASNPVSKTAENAVLVDYLDESVDSVRKHFNADVRYFGAAPVGVSNAKQIKNDSYLAILISVVLILGLLLWFFRSVKSIVLIAVPVLFGALMALAALYFLKGTISAIAIGAGSVIFGIAINYSLHYLIHAKYAHNQGEVLRDISSPMITGSITTVGAFLSLLFISADSMRDFGLFAAFSLAGTLLFVLIFLPHFLKNQPNLNVEKTGVIDRISGYRIDRNRWIITVVVLLTFVFFYFSFDVNFETEMNKINYMTPEQKESFEEMSAYTTLGEKSVYFVSDAATLDVALQQYESKKDVIDSLREAGTIQSISGIGQFLPSSQMQKAKIQKWNQFWESRSVTFKDIFVEEAVKQGFKKESFDGFLNALDSTYTVQPSAYFSIITENFLKDYLIVTGERAMVVSVINTGKDNTAEVSRKLSGSNCFVFDSGSVAQSLVDLLSDDFNRVLYICSFLVLLFLTISFGRLELSVIAFLPMLISWIWILGIMSVFGVGFNIVNIILATFIFGLGDDYTIFMMEGMMSEYASRRKLLSSYKTAVVLSAVTMFVGIGTLVFAKHPAMKSLGNVTIIGMISVVLISFIIPPIFYHAITYKNGKKRLIPVTFVNFFATVYSFCAFLLGTLVLTCIGFFLLGISRKTDKNKLRYHKAMQYVTDLVTRKIPFVKREIINEYNEDFSQPGVIICNHQAHIDLMYIMMLSPKIVILTNEWVWNSPFYGRMIRYADYYPVATGIENSIARLGQMVEKGYSIMVFPEGTRSEDCSILRFHRGAFYLAEKLNLDIIPVIVHGLGHALPKKEMLLRKGKATIKILQRIKPDDKMYGDNYSERARNIRKMYIEEYGNMVDAIETPSYFSNLVIHNYVYKGAFIERSARRLMRSYSNFEALITSLPDTGRVCIAECGFGTVSLMISLVKKNLQVYATDNDRDKLDIAGNCVSNPPNLHYSEPADEDIDYSEFDLIAGVEPSEQTIRKCLLANRDFIFLVAEMNSGARLFVDMGCVVSEGYKKGIWIVKNRK